MDFGSWAGTGGNSAKIVKIYGPKLIVMKLAVLHLGTEGLLVLSAGQTGPVLECGGDCLWEVIAQLERVKERRKHN